MGNRWQQNHEEAKAARAAADSWSHGGTAIKISFGVHVFTVVTKMQKPEPSGRRT